MQSFLSCGQLQLLPVAHTKECSCTCAHRGAHALIHTGVLMHVCTQGCSCTCAHRGAQACVNTGVLMPIHRGAFMYTYTQDCSGTWSHRTACAHVHTGTCTQIQTGLFSHIRAPSPPAHSNVCLSVAEPCLVLRH